MDTTEYDYLFKYIMVGDSNVGKSTLLWMFVDRKFKEENQPTLGVQFASKRIAHNDKIIKLQVWDTAGQEAFRTITRSYYKNTIGVILTFDVSRRVTFQSIESWLSQIKQHVNQNVEIVVVGNKSDLGHQVGEQQIVKLGYPYFLTSAKDDENVQDAFMELIERILKKLQNNEIDLNDHHCGVRIGMRTKAEAIKEPSLKLQKSKSNKNKNKGGICC